MDAHFIARKKISGIFRFFLISALNLSLLVVEKQANAKEANWGFWAHKRINRLATYRLPPQMLVFYKKHIDYITENATNPDKRRYAVVGEAEKHYIDLDVYGDSALVVLPKSWRAAIDLLGEDSLRKHGIVPWQIQLSAYQLTEAFKSKSPTRILKISADLGHYVADAHVPLHTTRNYNGQLTGQDGIHGFWESRLPELFAEEYDLWLGPATYCDNIANEAWKMVRDSHVASDSVFLFEKELTERFRKDAKYSYELRNNVLTRNYSRDFSNQYHQMLRNQVERRMKAAVKMVADIWYTCWVNAGQPDLRELSGFAPGAKETREEAEEQRSWLKRIFNARPEPD